MNEPLFGGFTISRDFQVFGEFKIVVPLPYEVVTKSKEEKQEWEDKVYEFIQDAIMEAMKQNRK